MNDRQKKKNNKIWYLDCYVMGKKRCTAKYKSEKIRRLSERVLVSLGAKPGVT